MSDFAKRLKLGATGAFPQGKIHATDEGELRMAVSSNGRMIRLDFGKPTAWIGFGPDEARQFAALPMQHAARCTGSHGN